jgi:hypothetical protein
MAKEIRLTVRRSASDAEGYDVAVDPSEAPGLAGANRNVKLTDVVPTARALLTWLFREGDTIVYCNLAFDDIDQAVRAVELARRGWT